MSKAPHTIKKSVNMNCFDTHCNVTADTEMAVFCE